MRLADPCQSDCCDPVTFPVRYRLALLWHFVIEGVCEKFLTMRAAQWRRLSEEVEDRLPDGWHARFWRRTPDSFFSVPLP